MNHFKVQRLPAIALFLFGLALSVGAFASERNHAQGTSDADPAPDFDWVRWLTSMEDLYLSDSSEEGMCWLLRPDLQLPGDYYEIHGEIEILRSPLSPPLILRQ